MQTVNGHEVRKWLVDMVAEQRGVDSAAVDADKPLEE